MIPLQGLTMQDNCNACGASLNDAMRYCPTCMADAGAPNVRACCSDENLKALGERFDKAKSQAYTNGCQTEFLNLYDILKNESCVVVSMPAGVGRSLFENPKELYANYEKLVGAKVRVPASSDDDKNRYAIAGMLFGSYADSIIYGVLSLTEYGLPTYGGIHCKLRPVAIDLRTSFLETNSYKFIKDQAIVAGDELPKGFSACWNDRQKLVLAKITGSLSVGQGRSDWQEMIIHSDGKSRENDEFVEAHIYDGFNWNAIESLEKSTNVKMTRAENLDFDLAKSAFNRLRGKSK